MGEATAEPGAFAAGTRLLQQCSTQVPPPATDKLKDLLFSRRYRTVQALRINQVSPLEITMREVLDGLDDLASGFAWQSTPGVFEIIAIEAPREQQDSHAA